MRITREQVDNGALVLMQPEGEGGAVQKVRDMLRAVFGQTIEIDEPITEDQHYVIRIENSKGHGKVYIGVIKAGTYRSQLGKEHNRMTSRAWQMVEGNSRDYSVSLQRASSLETGEVM